MTVATAGIAGALALGVALDRRAAEAAVLLALVAAGGLAAVLGPEAGMLGLFVPIGFLVGLTLPGGASTAGRRRPADRDRGRLGHA